MSVCLLGLNTFKLFQGFFYVLKRSPLAKRARPRRKLVLSEMGFEVLTFHLFPATEVGTPVARCRLADPGVRNYRTGLRGERAFRATLVPGLFSDQHHVGFGLWRNAGVGTLSTNRGGGRPHPGNRRRKAAQFFERRWLRQVRSFCHTAPGAATVTLRNR